jgi:hypothetical protein
MASGVMPEYMYRSSVTEEEFKGALVNLQKAIEKKDTPEEWAKFTARTLLLVGKLAINHFGFGPALLLIEEVFGPDSEILELIKLLGDKNENN